MVFYTRTSLETTAEVLSYFWMLIYISSQCIYVFLVFEKKTQLLCPIQ